jgi:hypothetical protein
LPVGFGGEDSQFLLLRSTLRESAKKKLPDFHPAALRFIADCKPFAEG